MSSVITVSFLSTVASVICWLVSSLGGVKSINDFCSLAFAFSPSQSSLDQSEGLGEGCGALYLQ